MGVYTTLPFRIVQSVQRNNKKSWIWFSLSIYWSTYLRTTYTWVDILFFMVSRMHSVKLFFFISYSLGRFLFDLAIFFGLKYILQMYNIGSIYRFVHNVIDKIMPFEFQLMQLARCSYCNVVKRNNNLKFKACFDIDTIYPTNNLIYNKANEKIQFLVFFF